MAYKFGNLRVLVVETSNIMFNLTRSVLHHFGVKDIVSAFNIEEGYKHYMEFKPDIIIMDWMNNTADGIELTKMIRQRDDSHNRYIPIIMMTGFSHKKCVEIARDTGVNEFVVKPFTAASLYEKLEMIIENPRLFVKSKNFVGPDRRRKREGFTGNDKRGGRSDRRERREDS